MKIHKFLDGPIRDGYGFVYNVCLMTDGRGNFWEEEVYYDDMIEAELDIAEFDGTELELEEDYLEDDDDYE
jgi:hypothetical protein